MKKDAETRFLEGLIELQYGVRAGPELREIAQRVSWARGWPEDVKAFWNAEAYMWGRKIEPKVRTLIAQELLVLNGKKNLDLGCGSYSYFPSVGFDISPKMLEFNERCTRKVCGDLEKELPFRNGEFESVTAVFVLNYVRNYEQLLAEISRVMVPRGIFMMVLSGRGIKAWQGQKEVGKRTVQEWIDVLTKAGFQAEFYEKGSLWFFCSRNQRK